MFNFSIKESLNQLKLKNYDSKINKTIDLLNSYEDYQLEILASNEGIKLNDIVRLNFINNIGFRCYNIRQERYGRLPLCNSIEKFLNEKYKESLTDTYNISEFIKSELINRNDYENWRDFVDNQKMGDCQGICYDIDRITEANNLPIEHFMGEIDIDEPFYSVNSDEYLDRFVHHWVTINGNIYEFSKGTLKDYIDWNDIYDVEGEDENIYHII